MHDNSYTIKLLSSALLGLPSPAPPANATMTWSAFLSVLPYSALGTSFLRSGETGPIFRRISVGKLKTHLVVKNGEEREFYKRRAG